MHAQRLDHDHDHDHDEPEPSSELDLSCGPDNDNAHARPIEDDGAPSVENIIPRGPSRRLRYVIAAVITSLSLSAYAFTRPPNTPQHDAPPPVTRVDIAERATPVAEASSPELVVADAPSHHRARGAHARRESSPAVPSHEDSPPAVEAPVTQRAATRPEPPLARLVTREEAAESEAHASEGRASETPSAEAPASDGETSEEALPTDSADEVVEAAVSAHSSEVDECISDAPDEAEGRLTVHLVIARDGAVRSATPHGPEGLHSVGQCIARAMRSWRMPVPDATGDTTISWPFEVESNR